MLLYWGFVLDQKYLWFLFDFLSTKIILELLENREHGLYHWREQLRVIALM